MLTNAPALPSYLSKWPAQLTNTPHTRQQLETRHNYPTKRKLKPARATLPCARGEPLGGLRISGANSASPPHSPLSYGRV